MRFVKRNGCETTIALDEIIVISSEQYYEFQQKLQELVDEYRL
jgi:hypothetical protein